MSEVIKPWNKKKDTQRIENFKLRESIWENIKLIVSLAERDEVKRIIGQSLIDETLELHAELQTHYEIWEEYHQQVTNTTCQPCMPEPPLLRENLEKQISLLVQLLQQKRRKQGKGSMAAFLSEDEKVLIKSVSRASSASSVRSCNDQINTATSNSCSRLSSSLSIDAPTLQASSAMSCEDQLNTATRISCSRLSSSLSIDAPTLQENFNYLDVDNIVESLRHDFEEERRILLSDITTIQNSIISENEQHIREKREQQASPSLQELRRLSLKLEKEVLHKIINNSDSCNQKRTVQTKSIGPPNNHRLSPLSSENPMASRENIPLASINLNQSFGNKASPPVSRVQNKGDFTNLTPSPPCFKRTTQATVAGNLRKTMNMRELAEKTAV